jgi:uncharacterized protein
VQIDLPEIDPEALAALCRRHGIARLSLFGSVARGEATVGSDLDLLIEFEPERTPGFLALAGIESDLAGLLPGQTLDLRTPAEISPYFRAEVMDRARVLYDGG